jgi:hypothetical protein
MSSETQGNRQSRLKGRGVQSKDVMRLLQKVRTALNQYPTNCDQVAGGCDVDKAYAGPKLTLENGKYSITLEFIKGMIEWFKAGKALPKRYVWEIVLGAHDHFASGDSLVDVALEDGVTCDVIGDVHGE